MDSDPCGPVRGSSKLTRVTDADEEVFLLYTRLAARGPLDGSTPFRGLGHVDSHKDTLTIELTIDIPNDSAESESSIGKAKKRKSKKARQERTFSIELAQDKTALRSRKGDTGSVVWHASVDFAQTVLRELYTRAPDALLDPALLQNAHVFELGAGTGLLSIVLSPLVSRYTVTDVDDLVPLIQKNLAVNLPKFPPLAPHSSRRPASSRADSARPHNVTAEALDWSILYTTPPSSRQRLFTYPPVDLVLVVDCIYHPSLLPALLSTIDYLAVPGKTAVLVVVELRAEDVVREFLERWLSLSSEGEWHIWSVGEFLEGPYAVWIAWKK